MLPYNRPRGEVVANLGGQAVRLCVTLQALAQLETHLEVSGLEAIGTRLAQLMPSDILFALEVIKLDRVELSDLAISLNEAVQAVVMAFAAMNEAP